MRTANLALAALAAAALFAPVASAQTRTITAPSLTLVIPAAPGGANTRDGTLREVSAGNLDVDVQNMRSTSPDGREMSRLVPTLVHWSEVALRGPLDDGAGRALAQNAFTVAIDANKTLSAAVAEVRPEPVSVEVVQYRTTDASGQATVQLGATRVHEIRVHVKVDASAAAEVIAWRRAVATGNAASLRSNVTISVLSTASRPVVVYTYGNCLPASIGMPIGASTTEILFACESFAAKGIRPWLETWVGSTLSATTRVADLRRFSLVDARSDGSRVELAAEGAVLAAYEPPTLARGSTGVAVETATLAFLGR